MEQREPKNTEFWAKSTFLTNEGYMKHFRKMAKLAEPIRLREKLTDVEQFVRSVENRQQSAKIPPKNKQHLREEWAKALGVKPLR